MIKLNIYFFNQFLIFKFYFFNNFVCLFYEAFYNRNFNNLYNVSFALFNTNMYSYRLIIYSLKMMITLLTVNALLNKVLEVFAPYLKKKIKKKTKEMIDRSSTNIAIATAPTK